MSIGLHPSSDRPFLALGKHFELLPLCYYWCLVCPTPAYYFLSRVPVLPRVPQQLASMAWKGLARYLARELDQPFTRFFCGLPSVMAILPVLFLDSNLALAGGYAQEVRTCCSAPRSSVRSLSAACTCFWSLRPKVSIFARLFPLLVRTKGVIRSRSMQITSRACFGSCRTELGSRPP